MCCSESSADYSQDDSEVVIPEPEAGICEEVAVNGAQIVIDAWPARVREVGCYRPPELCDTPSDHCDGMAIDFMISDAGGVSNMSRQWALSTIHHHDNIAY